MREGARRAKSKHAEDGKKSGGFLKFLIFAIIFTCPYKAAVPKF